MTTPWSEWLVSGRVQGVGFRWFVLRKAGELGVVGWVANLPDGRVQVVARGGEEAMESLDALLRLGPRLAVVSHVERSVYQHEVDDIKMFEVR